MRQLCVGGSSQWKCPFVTLLLKSCRTSPCRCTQTIYARDSEFTDTSEKIFQFWNGEDNGRCEIFSYSFQISMWVYHKKPKTFNCSPLSQPPLSCLESEELQHMHSSGLPGFFKGKMEISYPFKSSTYHPHKELLFWVIWRRKQEYGLYHHLFLTPI